MRKVDIVIGAGYGDEGKGLVTDYLSHNHHDVAVARFSGGANAGHTVELEDGTRHVFHHFGSGSFTGAHTILTRDFVVNPLLFWHEAEELAEKVGKIPHVYIDPECMVTTPYDVYLNQEAERVRNDGRHGSTGVGLGETVHREESGYSLRIKDFYQKPSEVRQLIKTIRDEYFWKRLEEIGGDAHSSDLCLLNDTVDILIDSVHDMLHQITVVSDVEAMNVFEHVVFEGSQGLFLDQNSRDFPHVTRANTGLVNVAQYLDTSHTITVHYVTRSYLTRHGAGVMEREDCLRDHYEEDKTNVTNEWQGALRYAPLDIQRMKEEVENDLKNVSGLNVKVCTAITWAKEDNPIISDLIKNVALSLKADKVLISYGKTRNDMVAVNFVDMC